jgi:hypothetical protein
VNDDPPDLEDLELLGQVDPPPPGVLDAARELLWSAVAAEMLPTAPDAANTGGAKADAAHPVAAHLRSTHPGGEPAATLEAEEPVREPRRADPGAS